MPFLGVSRLPPRGGPASSTRGVAGLDRAWPCVEIDLGPLDHDEVGRAGRGGRGRHAARPACVDRIVALAQGNPFFALELRAPRSPTARRSRRRSGTRSPSASSTSTTPPPRCCAGSRSPATTSTRPSVAALTGLAEAERVRAARRRARRRRAGRRRRPLPLPARPGPPGARRAGRRRTTGSAIHRDTARAPGAAGGGPRPWSPGTGWTAAARTRRPPGCWPRHAGPSRSARSPTRSASSTPLLDHAAGHGEALRLRAEALDALGDARAPAAYAAAARVVGGPEAHDLRAMQALAQIKQGDPPGRCARWTGSTGDGPGPARPGAGAERRGRDGFRRPGARHREGRRVPPARPGVGGPGGARGGVMGAGGRRARPRRPARQHLGGPARHARAARAGDQRLRRAPLHDPAAALRGPALPDVVAFADSFLAEAQRLGAARGQRLRPDAAR